MVFHRGAFHGFCDMSSCRSNDKNFMKLTKIPLDKKNRMLRFGLGLHDGKFFIRIDLWFIGFRLS